MSDKTFWMLLLMLFLSTMGMLYIGLTVAESYTQKYVKQIEQLEDENTALKEELKFYRHLDEARL